MILESKGKIAEGLYAVGVAELPAYLLVGKTPALFDAGMTFMGPRYLGEVREVIGDAARLGFNFLTHSHYDHCGSVPYLKRRIPGLKVGASRLAADIFQRRGAVDLIRSLSKDYEERYRETVGGEDVSFDGLTVDIPLDDGAEMELGGGFGFRAIATPGHTRDSITYYIPRHKALITGESVGVFDKNFTIHPEFTASYRDYLSSLHKLALLDIEMILMGHFYALTGDDARRYIAESIKRTDEFRKRIEDYLNEANGDRSVVVRRIFKEDYEDTGAILQDARPYLINLEAKVRAVAEGR